MTDRRYSDDEVSAIFARAAEVEDSTPHAVHSREGMNLAQLQQIGREAGIAPELISRAARELDQPPSPAVPSILGLPLGVARTVELGRKLSDDEWDRFVVSLRETFNARGHISTQGAFRTWSNGNLHVMLEPSAGGHRVRFRTIKGNARSLIVAGALLLTFTAAILGVSYFTGGGAFARAAENVGVLGLIGGALAIVGGVQLPSWARTRRAQMDRLAESLLRGNAD